MGRRLAVRSAVVVALASCLLLLFPTAYASRAGADALTQLRATPGWGTRARTLLEEAEEEADLEGDDLEDEQNMEDEVEDAEADDGVEADGPEADGVDAGEDANGDEGGADTADGENATQKTEEAQGDKESIQTDFAHTDHTDLYTVKRERDRAWEQAKSSGGHPSSKPVPHRPQSSGGGGGGGGTHGHKAPLIEKGKWVEKGGEYAFVSTRGCVNETCPFTLSDENLKAALDLPSNANDAELLATVMNPSRWRRNCDQAYRDRVCRGSKHEMPRWCKGSAGPGGRYAHDLDDAEKGWIEQAGRRQESKQTLLVNHKAYLKEARIQRESMEYTKKALEAQEAVDEATKLALQRVRMEAEVLKQVEQDEAEAWHDLVEIRQKVVKYRTLTKEQLLAMEREEKEEEKQKERETRAKERSDRARERQQMEAQQKAKALMVERAKQKARAAQKELERALAIAAEKSTAEKSTVAAM